MNKKQIELYKAMFAKNQEQVNEISNLLTKEQVIEVIERADNYCNNIKDFAFELALPERTDLYA